jgi:uncharacterized protein (DUF433 family)
METDGWITSTAGVLGGKPCIRGTRISVEFLLELLASGASRDEIAASYPQVSAEAVGAALNYAAAVLRNETVWDVRPST